MEILVLSVRKFTRGIFHHYVVIMYNHRSVICSSTKLLILPHVNLICISCRSQHRDIGALPNSRYLGLLTNTEY